MPGRKSRPDFGIASPRRDYTLNKFRTDNVIQQAIPENYELSNTYIVPNTYGRVHRQPDGTIMTSNQDDVMAQPTLLQPPTTTAVIENRKPAFLGSQKEVSNVSLKPKASEFLPDKHKFKYDTGKGKSTVEVTMTGNDS